MKVGPATYLWKRAHYHLDEFKYEKCAEVVKIFLEGHKQSPVTLHFREEDNHLCHTADTGGKWKVGYPDAGVIWFSETAKTAIQGENTSSLQYNLNQPAIIRKLIDYSLSQGWAPETDKFPIEVIHALKFFDEMEHPNTDISTHPQPR